METDRNLSEEDLRIQWEKTHRRGKIVGGLLFITAGALYLAKQMGNNIPDWVFTWKMLLIAIGVHTAIKHQFRHFFWLPILTVGVIFLITQDLCPDLSIKNYILPLVIIMVGVIMIFKPRRKCNPQHHWKYRHMRHREKFERKFHEMKERSGEVNTNEDYIYFPVIFGGVQKNIISKDFKGGEIKAIFGGIELNMTQSDITNQAEIELTEVFGGLKLILPPHWKVKSEIATVFGSVEDKRHVQNDLSGAPEKLLILKGNVIFGGVEITSH